MFCEEAFKQTSLCWGVLGSLWWVNVGSVCWGLCLGSLMAPGGLRAQWKGFQTKFIMLGSVTGFSACFPGTSTSFNILPILAGQSSFSACLVCSFSSDALTHLLKKESKVLSYFACW